ncbi:response regulator receiver protein [Desulforamulus reducens MI-1]|uniref:Response regulator receiver protein n=1 Tax=Desulforamulus reducens (strain ATCC BAA-1160 / DSM 100696 / MI-1) TaxID=349161 RepID=A4J5B0_DESRM|nr:response regulator receiver protein [Desulforamulus reducens MI-1]
MLAHKKDLTTLEEVLGEIESFPEDVRMSVLTWIRNWHWARGAQPGSKILKLCLALMNSQDRQIAEEVSNLLIKISTQDFSELREERMSYALSDRVKDNPAKLQEKMVKLIIDQVKQEIWLGERNLALTRAQVKILLRLSYSPGIFVSPDLLYGAIYGESSGIPGDIKSHIKNIRKALGDSKEKQLYIESGRARGYRLVKGNVNILRA